MIIFWRNGVNQISVFAVYDLLVSPDCLPDLLQGGLKNKNVNDVFILTTFRVQNKAPVRVFRIYNPTDNTDHFDFTIHGKLNKGNFAVGSHLGFRRIIVFGNS